MTGKESDNKVVRKIVASRNSIEISNITSTRDKFCNLIADRVFTRNIPLARVVMFRNNVQCRSRRGTLKVLDPSPRNYVMHDNLYAYMFEHHAFENTYQTRAWLRPASVYTMFRVYTQVELSYLIFKRSNLIDEGSFRREMFALIFLAWRRVLPFPSASRAFSSPRVFKGERMGEHLYRIRRMT